MENNLPEGWVETNFNEVAEATDYVANGSFQSLRENVVTNKNRDYAILVRLKDFNNGWKENELVFVTKESYEFLNKSLLQPGDLFIANVGAPGKSFIVPDLKQPMTLGPNGLRIRANQTTSNKFLLYYYSSPFGRNEIEKLIGGSAQQKFNKTGLRSSIFLLPPLPEQHRIVAKLNELMEKTERSKKRLEKIPLILKRFRQSVLADAVNGKLTEEWREGKDLENVEGLQKKLIEYKQKVFDTELNVWKEKTRKKSNDKITKPPKPKLLPDVEDWEKEFSIQIPSIWKFVRFNHVTYKIGDIDHKMPKDHPNGISYLSTGDMKDVNNLDFENSKKISLMDYKLLSAKIKPERGDIIFPRYGTIGRNILVNFDKEFLVSYSCAIIKNFKEYMNPKYIYYVSISPFIKTEIDKHVVQTTQANIGIASIEKFLFPLCSFEEQNEIVHRVEALFAFADKIETRYTKAKAQFDKLPQALLAKAFKGELVEQDEKDESAGVLLERIRKDREKPKSKKSNLQHAI